MTGIPTSAGFWEPAWQAGERKAREQIMAGEVEVFDYFDAMSQR